MTVTVAGPLPASQAKTEPAGTRRGEGTALRRRATACCVRLRSVQEGGGYEGKEERSFDWRGHGMGHRVCGSDGSGCRSARAGKDKQETTCCG